MINKPTIVAAADEDNSDDKTDFSAIDSRSSRNDDAIDTFQASNPFYKKRPFQVLVFGGLISGALIIINPFGSDDAVREEAILSLESLIKQTSTSLKGLNEEVQAHWQQFTTFQAGIITQLTSKVSIGALDDLDTRLTNRLSKSETGGQSLKQRIAKLEAIEKSRVEAARQRHGSAGEKRMKPPFTLVSIDVWDGEANAILLAGRETALVATGEDRMGWRVKSIDYRNNTVIVKHIKTGKSATLNIDN